MLHSLKGRSQGHGALHWLAILVAGLALLLPGTQALAEATAPPVPSASTLSFDTMGLSIMPEYDQAAPQVLVIIRGALVNRGTEPVSGQEVIFRAPKGARWTAIAELSSDPLGPDKPVYHELLPTAKVTEQGDYVELALKMTKTVKPGEPYPLQAEFYYPGVAGGPEKSVQMAFLPTYSAKTLLLDIAEPKGAQGFTSSLGPGDSVRGGDGLTYHDFTLPGLQAGTPFRVDVSYKRAGNDPSRPSPPTAGTTGTQRATGGGTNTTAVVVGVLVLGGLVALLLFSGVGGSMGRTGRSARRRTVRGGSTVKAAGGGKAKQRVGGTGATTTGAAGVADPRARARDLLLERKISEDTYRTLIAELDAEEGR